MPWEAAAQAFGRAAVARGDDDLNPRPKAKAKGRPRKQNLFQRLELLELPDASRQENADESNNYAVVPAGPVQEVVTSLAMVLHLHSFQTCLSPLQKAIFLASRHCTDNLGQESEESSKSPM